MKLSVLSGFAIVRIDNLAPNRARTARTHLKLQNTHTMLKKILIALAIALLILLGAGLLAYRKVAPGTREAEVHVEKQRKRLQPGIL